MIKKSRLILKLFLLIIFGLCLSFVLPNSNSNIWAAAGQNCQPQPAPDNRSTALITARNLGLNNLFSNPLGVCIIGTTEAPIANIQSFADFKATYYNAAKSVTGTVNKNPIINSNATETDINMGDTVNQLFYIKGSLILNANPLGTVSGLVFVENDLEIKSNYTYGTASAGTIYIVKGDVYISPVVTRVDAVIIAEGTIYTAVANFESLATCSYATTHQRLFVNGSLISVGPNPIRFCRNLTDNVLPAETIIMQPKYLALFRNLLASDFTARVEDQVIGSYQNLAPPVPPTPIPSSIPQLTATTCTPSTTSAVVGQAVTWSTNASGGKTPLTYTWTDGIGGHTSSAASPNITYSSAGTFYTTVTIKDSSPPPPQQVSPSCPAVTVKAASCTLAPTSGTNFCSNNSPSSGKQTYTLTYKLDGVTVSTPAWTFIPDASNPSVANQSKSAGATSATYNYYSKNTNPGYTARAVISDGVSTLCNSTPATIISSCQTPPGTNYKRVFVTSGKWNGNLKTAGGGGSGTYAGLIGADNLCQNAANSAGLGGAWKAWLSTTTNASPADSTNGVRTFTQYELPYVLINSPASPTAAPIATGWSTGTWPLSSGNLQYPINITENLTTISAEYVWTNTKPKTPLGGSNGTNYCNSGTIGWDSSSSSLNGNYGDVGVTTTNWSNHGNKTCDLTNHLYCFEQ